VTSKPYDPKLSREYHLERASESKTVWDMIVIGGGATGAGITLDASTRGYSVILLESHDFGKGTSSRSTKLIHGGVRYLEQFQISMVRESLRERDLLLRNAPHLVHELEFIIPCQSWIDRCFYGIGLKVYDWLASRSSVRPSRQVGASEVVARVPNLAKGRFRGGVSYSDGQFDDTRLLIELIRGSVDAGATVLNYAPVISLLKKSDGSLRGVGFQDKETGRSFELSAKCVVNATGPFCDAVREMDDVDAAPLVVASQGVHLVLPRRFFPSQSAIIVPKTSDGRVLFMIPWHEYVVVGTTDTPIAKVTTEPIPLQQELDFLLATIAEYVEDCPSLSDCCSMFAGIRPLVRATAAKHTKKLSRDHAIEISPSGLLTITGGKWTTARHMAEDCVNQAAERTGLPRRPCVTYDLKLQSTLEDKQKWECTNDGSDNAIQRIHPELSISRTDLRRAVRFEFARTVEDLLARRTRALFLNARAAIAIAPEAASILANELERDTTWQSHQLREFLELASTYIPSERKS
jgi:glycerol-3-phosphate dehydrogenase